MRVLRSAAPLLLAACAAAPPDDSPELDHTGAAQGAPGAGPARAASTLRSAPGFDPGPLAIGPRVFERRVLANGLQALAIHEPTPASEPPSVSVFVVYAVGSGMESPSTTGLAHLVEHAMYTGTAQVAAGEHDAIVEGLGGESNAYTRRDYTLYYDHRIPPESLGRVLALEADRMRGLTLEREAVLHERWRLEVEERHAQDAARDRLELVESAVFRMHPYGVGVRSGGHTLAPKLALEEVRDFYDRWYHPSRCAVVVVGDMDATVALAGVSEAFADIPSGPPAPLVPTEPLDFPGGEVRFPSDLARERVVHAWVGPALFESEGGARDRLSLELLARVLDDDERQIDAVMGGGMERDLFRLERAGADAGTALLETRDELVERMSAERLARVRSEMAGEIEELGLRTRPYFSLGALAGVYAAHGQADYLARRAELVNSLELADVTGAVQRWLAPERRWVLRFTANADAGGLELPEGVADLEAFAQRAIGSGDLAGAAAAYERLLELGPNRMNTVIYLYQLGEVRVTLGELDQALIDLERALAVVDYPAVRELRDDVVRRLEERGAGSAKEPSREGAGSTSGESPSVGTPAPAETEPSSSTSDEPERPERPASGFGVTWEAELDPTLAAEAERLMAWIEQWRGLAFRADLFVEVVDEEDADEKLRGWYEPDTDRLVVVTNDAGRAARGTLLHEMVHALQDQHFDLEALHAAVGEGEDAQRALQALIEGEAMLAVSELMDYDFEQHTHLPPTGELDEARFEKVFHYGAGLRFVRALREAGGWAQVDEAWARPPRTTAAIYHPDRALAGVPAAVVDAELATQTRGEYGLALVLARDERTRPRAFALAGRLAHDRVEPGTPGDHGAAATEGAAAERWTLTFYDALGCAAAADALELLGYRVSRAASDPSTVIELTVERP